MLRWPLIGAALVALGVGTALGGWAWHEKRPRDVLGSPTEEFSSALRTDTAPVNKKKKQGAKPKTGRLYEEQWPTYGYDMQRTHLAPPGWRRLRPPFHGLWKLKARADIEFPPSVAYGKVYVAQQKGRFFALNGRTGKIVWTKHFEHCSAASPTIWDGIVYQAYMHELPCRKHETGAAGFVVALNARNGKEYWRVRAGSVESSPLLIGKTLYFGSWDRHLYSYRIRGKRKPLLKWTFTADDQIVAAPAQAGRLVVIATSSGSVYGVDAKTGRQRWHATSFSRFGRREYFYATPTVAYGRVFIGNADGTVYAYGASSGHLLWARQVGTYVYTAAAVWRKTVFVGTWDGTFIALDARTGEPRWRFDAPASITGAPTVLAGLVYFSTCGRCGAGGLRRVKIGPRGTLGLNARNGDLGLALPRRQVLGRSSRTASASTSRAETRSTRMITQQRYASAEEGEGPREVPEAEASKSASAMPVKGQARYDVWKTRLRNSKTNIETAKPSPAAQVTPLRRWFQSSQTVIGSQTTSASGTNG